MQDAHDSSDGLSGRSRAVAALRSSVSRPLMPLAHLYWRWSRGMTLGTRAMVITPADEIFLIKHSYVPGWHLPGGGVEVGETLHAALERELLEEGNIALAGAPALHGMYLNRRASPRDHVALFVVRAFSQEQPPIPDHEIVAHGFFPAHALPADTTPATRRRIAEVLGGAPPEAEW